MTNGRTILFEDVRGWRAGVLLAELGTLVRWKIWESSFVGVGLVTSFYCKLLVPGRGYSLLHVKNAGR